MADDFRKITNDELAEVMWKDGNFPMADSDESKEEREASAIIKFFTEKSGSFPPLTRETLEGWLKDFGKPEPPRPLNIVSEDCYGCCGALRKELRVNPELADWTCGKCGLPWKPRLVDGVRLWEAKPVFLAIRRR